MPSACEIESKVKLYEPTTIDIEFYNYKDVIDMMEKLNKKGYDTKLRDNKIHIQVIDFLH